MLKYCLSLLGLLLGVLTAPAGPRPNILIILADDLAAKDPEKVKALAAKWDAWAARANVLPLGSWKEQAKP